MTEDIDVHALAQQLEAKGAKLEGELKTLRDQKKRIATQISEKQEELDLVNSMRPRKRKKAAATVAAPTPPTE